MQPHVCVDHRPVTRPFVSIPHAVASGLGANLLWGISPLVWASLRHVPAGQVLAHRILWSILLVALGAGFADAKAGFRRLGTNVSAWGLAFVGALTVGSNWLINIWAVNAGHVVEASLGYYMSPIVSVILARVVLAERLRPAQQLACGAVSGGVGYMVWHLGYVPWTGLGLALTFATYGLMRKRSPLIGAQGFRVETLLLMPIALGYLGWQSHLGVGAFEQADLRDKAWLVFAGVFSGTPLFLFSRAAVRLRLTTLGILQYVMPTCQLLLAVFVMGEPLTRAHSVAFSMIWFGLIVYSGEGLVQVNRAAKLEALMHPERQKLA